MSNEKNVLEIPLDSDKLAEILCKYATDAFEVTKFLEAYSASVGKTIERTIVFLKLLDLMGVEEEDRVS